MPMTARYGAPTWLLDLIEPAARRRPASSPPGNPPARRPGAWRAGMRYVRGMALHPRAAAFLERQRRGGGRPDCQLRGAAARVEADVPTLRDRTSGLTTDGTLCGP